MIIPLFYGAMPNMGLYYTPDGPFENPGDLMKAFKIQEAWESMEHAAEHLTRDTVWVMQKLFASGADGVNFDTTAAAGDGDMNPAVLFNLISKGCNNFYRFLMFVLLICF